MNNLKRICGYNQAARYFQETKKPRTVRWGEDERPLYNTRSHHYRIVKGEDSFAAYYDLVLYSTSLIRYYKPDANNHQRVLVRGHSSTASRSFLWHHGMGMTRHLWCIDGYGVGREGKLLLNHAVHNSDKFGVPYNWSADLTFTDPDLTTIDLTRSRHVPGYKAASSDEDKAKRKQLKTTVDHWIELLGYRLDEYLNTEIDTNKWHKQRAGESFTSALDLLSWKEHAEIKVSLQHAIEGGDLICDEGFTNAMAQLGHAVATHLQGVRENKANMGWDYEKHAYIMDAVKPITRADFRKSMESHLISLLNLRTGSARVDIGQFPATIPRKWWC
jgi:hypothetical protein